MPTTFEWSDQIDLDRAKVSEKFAREALGNKEITRAELRRAEARLKRALVRQYIAELD